VKLNPATHPVLHFINPKLWWPKGYGEPNLYNVELVFKTDAGISDKKEFKSGIRKMTFDETNQILNIYINAGGLLVVAATGVFRNLTSNIAAVNTI